MHIIQNQAMAKGQNVWRNSAQEKKTEKKKENMQAPIQASHTIHAWR